MNFALGSNNLPFRIGNQILTLDGQAAPPPETPPAPVYNGDPISPTDGLVGAWDAGTLAKLNISSWGQWTYSITDSSTAGKNAYTDAQAYARQAGSLGGLIHTGGVSNYTVRYPIIRDFVVGANTIAVGAGGTFTVMLVWSRANQRQPDGQAFVNDSVSLIDIAGNSVLRMTGNGNGTDNLVLFANGTPVTAGVLKLRHTHCARLVFSGSTVDVWLDGAKVINGAANQITLGSTVNLKFLENAQCIFHESAAWNKALSASENAALTSYVAGKWPLGERRAANGILIGQSNAANLIGTFVLWHNLNRSVAYWTGHIASNLLYSEGGLRNINSGKTLFSGQGLYNGDGNWILNSSSGDSNVDNWPLGTNGNDLMTALDTLSADDKANLRYIAWYWSESDSSMLTYDKKNTYFKAMKRAFGLIRAKLGVTAAQLPIMVISALPFPNDAGCQTHREVIEDLTADATLNCKMMLAQSHDAVGQGSGWDSSTGLESGGNSAHRDSDGSLLFLRRAAAPIGRAVIAANAAQGTPDATTSIDSTVPVTGGPRITTAVYEGTTFASTGSVLVTVAHDGGNALAAPLRAAIGVGWRLMDGLSSSQFGTPGSPGALIQATACQVLSATTLRVTLASAPAFPSKAKLYYVYGTGLGNGDSAIIGRGNAVTDNFGSTSLTAGWNIGADTGSSSQPNYPLRATAYGVALS